MTQLTYLLIDGNQISDISPLANLINLHTLRLGENPVRDTSPLAELPKLTNLDVKISPPPPVVHLGPRERPPLYWIDAETETLYRVVGTEVEYLVPGVQQTRSLTVDTEGGKLYWTNSRGHIQRSNLNGKHLRNIIENLNAPDNIVVDVEHGKLYWTEAASSIKSADLNGEGIQEIANGMSSISSIAMSGNNLYWTEITGKNTGEIGHINLISSNPQILVTLRSEPRNIVIDALGRKLYWTDSNGNIRRSNLIGRRIKKVISGVITVSGFSLGSSSMATPMAPAVKMDPTETALHANFPNPFNPETWIPYQLVESTDVTITIYAMNGEVVRQLALGHQAAGVYQSRVRAAYWDGRNALGEPVASGIYFYTLTTGDFTATRKMLIRK